MLKLLSFRSSPRKRGPGSSYDRWIWPLGPLFRGDKRRKGLAGLFSFAIAALLASLVAPATAAETLRVGKAGREAFSFVPADVGARRSKALDAAMVNLAVALNYVQRGEGRILLRFNELLKDFHVHVIFATNKAIAVKPAALTAFMAGWFETIAFMRGNRAATIAIAKDVMQTDEATTAAIFAELIPMFSDTV